MKNIDKIIKNIITPILLTINFFFFFTVTCLARIAVILTKFQDNLTYLKHSVMYKLAMVVKILSSQTSLYKNFYANQVKNSDNLCLNKLHSNTTNENFDGKEWINKDIYNDIEKSRKVFDNLKQKIKISENDINNDENFNNLEQLAEDNIDEKKYFTLKKVTSSLSNLSEKLKQKIMHGSTLIPSFLEDQREKRVNFSGEWDLGGCADLEMWGCFAEKSLQYYFAISIIVVYIGFIAKGLYENFFYVVFKDYQFDEIEWRKWVEPILVLGGILTLQILCPEDLKLIHLCFAVHIFVWVIVRWYGFIIQFIRACKFQADVEILEYNCALKDKLHFYGITMEAIHLASLVCYWTFILFGYVEMINVFNIQYFEIAYAADRKPINNGCWAYDDIFKKLCKDNGLDSTVDHSNIRKIVYDWRFRGFHRLKISLSLYNDDFKLLPRMNDRDRANLNLFSNYLPNFQIHKAIFGSNSKVSTILYKIPGPSSSSNDPKNVGFSLLTQTTQKKLLTPLSEIPVMQKVIINPDKEISSILSEYKKQRHSLLKLINSTDTLFSDVEVRYLNDFHKEDYKPGSTKWCIEQRFNYCASAPGGWVLQSYYNNLTHDTLLNMPSRYLISLHHGNYVSDKRFGIDLIALNKRISYAEFTKRVKIEITYNNSRPGCLLPEREVNKIFRYSFQFYGNFHELTELFLDNKMTPKEFLNEAEKILPKIYKQSLHLGEETYKYCFDCLSVKLKAIKPNEDLDDNPLIKSLIEHRWTIFEAYYIYQPRFVAFENQIRLCNPLDFNPKQSGQIVMAKSTKWDTSRALPNKFRGAWDASLKQNVWYIERDLLNHFKSDPETFPIKRKIKDGQLNTYLERGSSTNCKRGLQLTSNGILSQKKMPLTHCNFPIKARLLADMQASQILPPIHLESQARPTIPTESKEEKKWH